MSDEFREEIVKRDNTYYVIVRRNDEKRGLISVRPSTNYDLRKYGIVENETQ